MRETITVASACASYFRRGDVIALSRPDDLRVVKRTTATTLTVRYPYWWERAWWALKAALLGWWQSALAWIAARRAIRRARKPD